MMKFSDWLIRNSKGWIVTAALITFALFLIFILPAQPKIAVIGNSDPGYPDLAFWYSSDQLYGFLPKYMTIQAA